MSSHSGACWKRLVCILVLDDEERVRAPGCLVEETLRDTRYRLVTTSGDPLALPGQLAADPPGLLVLDPHLPGINGLKVLRRLRSIAPEDDYLPARAAHVPARVA